MGQLLPVAPWARPGRREAHRRRQVPGDAGGRGRGVPGRQIPESNLRINLDTTDVADSLSHRAAFAGVQGHQARGCHVEHLLEK